MDKIKLLMGLKVANDQIIFLKYLKLLLAQGNENDYKELRGLYDLWLKNLCYSEYLLTKEWQKIKKKKFRQSGYKCEVCGNMRIKLHIHHLTYKNHPYPELKDLMILCPKCHKKIHESKAIKSGIETKAKIFNAFTE